METTQDGREFYVVFVPTGREELGYLDLATNMSQPLYLFDRKLIAPISYAGNFIYYSQFDQITSNLMMVEHFQ